MSRRKKKTATKRWEDCGRKPRDQRDTRIDPELASALCDDLPDGAYFAMMEELTGLEPCDLVEDCHE